MMYRLGNNIFRGAPDKPPCLSFIPTTVFLLFVFLIASSTAAGVDDDSVLSSHQFNDESHPIVTNHTSRYKLITFNFDHVEVPYVICLWILLASIAKIGFHLYDKLPHIFPESCLLITLGILVGVTLYFTETASSGQYSLDANTFFLFLLPPIIYDAGYHMPNRAFFNNIGTILLLAVVNTLWNTFGIGVCLWGMSRLGWINSSISLLHCFVFSSLISAVDPVAVLAIFEEIQVNEILYIIVFGESLLNDGVTVVLYHMMDGFTEIGESNLHVVDFVTGFAQFFIVVFGGTLIGVVYGLMGAFITKYTDHVRVLEPLFVFVLGYLAYLTAECMELSGILALTFGGIVMRHYTELNMAKKSTTTVKYFMKMLANISETIIFMFLGLSVVIDSHDVRLDFILFSLLFCLIFRVTGVVMLSWLVNQRRLIRLSAIDQFIMSYGGLRGGIAFCLALLLNADHIPERQMFVTTTTVIVFFTVFIQGITIKPVVNALKVERAEEIDTSMNEMIHKRFIDHLMAGVEDIVGKSGHNSIFQRFDYYNDKFLKPWLLREKPKLRDHGILRTYTRLNMQDAKTVAKAFPVSIPRELSMTNLNTMSHSPSAAQMYNMGRRATISVPSNRDMETIINLHSDDPMFQKHMNDSTSRLQDALIEPRNGYHSERRHTLAEIHNREPPVNMSNSEQLRDFITDLQRGVGFSNIHNNNNPTAHNNNNHQSNGGLNAFVNSNKERQPESPVSLSGSKSSSFLPSQGAQSLFPVSCRPNRNISFNSPGHKRLTKKLSDVAELHPDAAHEVSLMPNETQEKQIVFTLGQPAPNKKQADKVTGTGKTEHEMDASLDSTIPSSNSLDPALISTSPISEQPCEDVPKLISTTESSNHLEPKLVKENIHSTHCTPSSAGCTPSDLTKSSSNPKSSSMMDKPLHCLADAPSTTSTDSDVDPFLNSPNPQPVRLQKTPVEYTPNESTKDAPIERERTQSDPIDIPRAGSDTGRPITNETGSLMHSRPGSLGQDLWPRRRKSSSSNKDECQKDSRRRHKRDRKRRSVSNDDPHFHIEKDRSFSSSPTSSKEDCHVQNDTECQEQKPNIATVAETSLPWRRNTSVSPVPSSLSQSLPDEEKPLHSEAPSWADNPEYNHLTENGSPYHSPNNTITAVPRCEPPRLVFDLFPSSPSEPGQTEISKTTVLEAEGETSVENVLKTNEEDEKDSVDTTPFIPPPPWATTTHDCEGEEPQALPSQSMASHASHGDKAACFLVSAHDLVPPSHHTCLDPVVPIGGASQSSSHKHSLASSPLHFQCMEKPQAVSPASVEAQLIGTEATYHHQMKDRVAEWLAAASSHVQDEEDEREEQRNKIMNSLKEKRERWAIEHETDEGTDADVESDFEDETIDTKL